MVDYGFPKGGVVLTGNRIGRVIILVYESGYRYLRTVGAAVIVKVTRRIRRVELMGIIMADSAAGDIMIVRDILRYRSTAEEVVYIDHPTQAGGVIFER